MPSLKKVKQEAWDFYQKWRKEETYSPAFKSTIRVSLIGWKHISPFGGIRKRTYQDAYRRYKLLPHAKEIIEKSTTIQNVVEKGGRKFYALEAMVKVAYKNNPEDRKVRVILVEDKLGNKVFFSVMDRKT